MVAVGFKNNEVIRETGKKWLRNSGFLETFRWPEPNDFASAEMFSVDERSRLLYPVKRIP